MKNIVIALTALILIFFESCKKEQSKNSVSTTAINIAYKNSFGADLFNTSTANHFYSDSIHVYNVSDGIKYERYYSNLDNPRLWNIFKVDSLNTYFLGIGVETDTTLLELNKNIIDTITVVIDNSNGNSILRKVWYNGVLEWDNIDLPQTFTIVKP